MSEAVSPEKSRKKTPRLRRILYTAGITLGILLALAYLGMEKILFPAPGRYSERVGNVVIQSGDAELDAFFHAPADPAKPVILHSHGNGESLRYMFPAPRDYIRRGYGILVYDYAGYGASSGKAGEKQSCMDIAAAYDFLRNTKKIPPEKILPVGFSVGSGPSSFLAANYPVPGLVLCAPLPLPFRSFSPFPSPGTGSPMRITLLPNLSRFCSFMGKGTGSSPTGTVLKSAGKPKARCASFRTTGQITMISLIFWAKPSGRNWKPLPDKFAFRGNKS